MKRSPTRSLPRPPQATRRSENEAKRAARDVIHASYVASPRGSAEREHDPPSPKRGARRTTRPLVTREARVGEGPARVPPRGGGGACRPLSTNQILTACAVHPRRAVRIGTLAARTAGKSP